jgi:prophage antirepressor-like protein
MLHSAACLSVFPATPAHRDVRLQKNNLPSLVMFSSSGAYRALGSSQKGKAKAFPMPSWTFSGLQGAIMQW